MTWSWWKLVPLFVLGNLLHLQSARAECKQWSQSRCDESNVASIDLGGTSQEEFRAWSHAGSGRVWGYEPGLTTWSSPAIAMIGETPMVFVGNYDHTLYALEALTGKERWKFNTGEAIQSSPVIAIGPQEATLFVSSNDRSIYAIDAQYGRQKWVYTVEPYRPSLGGARLAAPCLGKTAKAEPILFVPYWVWDRSLSNGKQKSAVVALTQRGGERLWETQVSDGELTAAVFAQIQGKSMLFIGSNSGNLVALDGETGKLLWKRTELDSVRSPPAVATYDGKKVLITASKYGIIRGIEPVSGKAIWALQTGDRITGSPAVNDKMAYVGSYDRHLYGIDLEKAAFSEKIKVRSGVFSSPAYIRETHYILFMAWDDMLHVRGVENTKFELDTFTGKPIWNVAGMDDSNWSSPAAAKIGDRWMVFVGSYDGKFRAISLARSDRIVSKQPSNFWFWLSFPMLLGPIALLARILTLRSRRKGTTSPVL